MNSVQQSDPKISVITVSYQHADFIRQTIESVLLQRYSNFEHIVVDGGSTDGTLEILQAYPHLLWTSEPDRGQSHALNKGFARAKGDIIAWLNSDDWYPPGIFSDVVLALEEYPIVMGECEVVDKYGVRKHSVKNIERTWFDLVKHWVFCSSPAQPSLFFRRDLLEEVKYEAGKYLDENLEFCMDLDLWLRIAEKCPLARRVPKVFSYVRTYESNKTGEMMDLTYREMSRVYERHSRKRIGAETRQSILVPIDDEGVGLDRTVESFKFLTPHSAELVVVDGGGAPEVCKKLRRKVLEMARTVTNNTVRYVRSEPGNQFESLTEGFLAARAPLVTVVQPGDRLLQDWVERCEREFDRDNAAFALLYDETTLTKEQFLLRTERTVAFRGDSIFVCPRILPNFVARTIALHELHGFRGPSGGESASPLLALRLLMFRLLYKGWSILGEHGLSIEQGRKPYALEEAQLSKFQLFINATLIQRLTEERLGEPFAEERIRHGFAIAFPEHLITSAGKLLELAPKDWPDIVQNSIDQARLEECVVRAPLFGPAWAMMGDLARTKGDQALLSRALAGLENAERAVSNL